MRELEVLGNGHLKLDFADCQEFFTQDLHEMVRAQLKCLLQQALLAERDRYLDLGYYEHAPMSRIDFRNGYYHRDLVTQLGLLARIRVPRTRKGFRSQLLPRYQRRQQAVNNLILLAFFCAASPLAKWARCSNPFSGKPTPRKPFPTSPANSTTPSSNSIGSRYATTMSICFWMAWCSKSEIFPAKCIAAGCWWLTARCPAASGKSSLTTSRSAKAKPPGWNFCRIFICAACMAKT